MEVSKDFFLELVKEFRRIEALFDDAEFYISDRFRSECSPKWDLLVKALALKEIPNNKRIYNEEGEQVGYSYYFEDAIWEEIMFGDAEKLWNFCKKCNEDNSWETVKFYSDRDKKMS